MRGHAADARVYRHFVVVKNDDDFGFKACEAVQRLEGDAVEERAVADHRYDLVLLAAKVAGFGVAHRRGDRGAAVAGGKKVVGALVHARKTGDAPLPPQSLKAAAALREQFIGVALVPDVEDYFVHVGVEYAQQRHR